MSDPSNATAIRPLGGAPGVAAALAAAIALCVLAGWTFGVAALKSVLPGAIEMKANTAFGLLAAATSLFLLSAPVRPVLKRLGQAVALAVTLLGLASLGEYVFEWNLALNELVFSDPREVQEARGRMSPYSAAAFICLGLALLCLPWRQLHAFVWSVAGGVILIATVSVIGYLWNAGDLQRHYELPPVAVNTAVAFILIAAGTLVASMRQTVEPRLFPAGASGVERKVLAGFLAALVLMFIAGTFTYRAGTDLADGKGSLARSQALRLAARQLYATVSDAESAQRGYLLTGRADLREGYAQRASEVERLEPVMRRLVRDTAQRADLDEIKALVARRLSALQQQIGLYHREGPGAARNAVAAEASGELMRAIHAATERISRGEEDWLADREAESVRSRLLTLISLGLTFVVATGILLVLFRGIRREMVERARQDAEIRALAAALARRASEVEAVNKELEAFSYSVSHDLRAPLRHINGYVELLTSSLGADLGDEPRRYLGVITKASEQMSELIEDLLAFSRMTRADMHSTRIDLRGTVDSAIAGLEMFVRGRNIEWRIGELPPVEGDPAMLKLVYTNLIGNAVKYSAPRDPATIEIGAAGEEDGRTILYVRDNGVGFDMKYAGKLFGIFQRMHHPDEFEGTGIGLATVQRIVNRHGGRIWAQAVAGEGATFYFTLQKSIVDSQAR